MTPPWSFAQRSTGVVHVGQPLVFVPSEPGYSWSLRFSKHTWPSDWRYNIALGQGCPDTAPCDPNYIGFFHQIYGAARQMQIYMEGRWFQWYAPGKTWNILYNPNANCGSSPVYVANKATSALYYYTPYQPNEAALNGRPNNCSSFGNLNFWQIFRKWFGATERE